MSLEEARERVRRHIGTGGESHGLLRAYARGEMTLLTDLVLVDRALAEPRTTRS